jgi:hypothetical protein
MIAPLGTDVPDAGGDVSISLARQHVSVIFPDADGTRPVTGVSHVTITPTSTIKLSLLEVDPRDIAWVPDLLQLVHSVDGYGGETSSVAKDLLATDKPPDPFLATRIALSNGSFVGDNPRHPFSKHVTFGFDSNSRLRQPIIDGVRYRSNPARAIALMLKAFDSTATRLIELWPASGDTVRVRMRNRSKAKPMTDAGGHLFVSYHLLYPLPPKLPLPGEKNVCHTNCQLTGCDYPVFCPPSMAPYQP